MKLTADERREAQELAAQPYSYMAGMLEANIRHATEYIAEGKTVKAGPSLRRANLVAEAMKIRTNMIIEQGQTPQ